VFAFALPTRLFEVFSAEVVRVDLFACVLCLPEVDPSADLCLVAVIDAFSKMLFVQVEDDVIVLGDELSVWTVDTANNYPQTSQRDNSSEMLALNAR